MNVFRQPCGRVDAGLDAVIGRHEDVPFFKPFSKAMCIASALFPQAGIKMVLSTVRGDCDESVYKFISMCLSICM